ncbi:MAG: hypothetical protein KF813_02285 [Trueperaceae bacterium]|nr:hypothetical protein [Trueperaceae bacterium]
MSRGREIKGSGAESKMRRYGVAAVLAVIGGVLLWRAFQGGGPLFYFFSAVFIGMAYAAASGAKAKPSPKNKA